MQVGVQGRDEGVIGGVEEGEGFGAVGVGLVELEGVVDDGVGLEVLMRAWLVTCVGLRDFEGLVFLRA